MPGTTRRRSSRGRLLLFAAVLLAPLPFGPLAAAQPGGPGEARRREDARAHFQRGIALRDQERWADALTEFQTSRSLFMTLNGTTNAAACLIQLERYLEAIELYESALNDFSERLKGEDKRDILLVVKLLYNAVGTIGIAGAEPGATLLLDGLSRGELPLGAPLRVPRGLHTVRVVKAGYQPFEQRLDVDGGETVQVTARLIRLKETGTLEIAEPTRDGPDARPIRLARDAESIDGREERGPRRTPRWLAEVSAAAPLIVSFGGDAPTGCVEPCSKPLGSGVSLIAHGGYGINHLSFGVSAGYLGIQQAVRGRIATLEAAGGASYSVRVDDTTALRGALLGAWVGYSSGERLLLHARLGAGGLFGAVAASRTSARASASGALSFGPLERSAAARFVYVAPEVRAGVRLARRVELTLGLEVPLLIAVPRPASSQQVFVDTAAGVDHAASAWFPGGPLTAPLFPLFIPALSARYDFY
ncbi:PEGA domain-containing protein [Sorangium atrum]|uniref:PEGA domain-containing protein n=1 Tax=Sorangium atrum TaxID=2995308 RepID=A0ABT5BUF1_9BACT|nr:PEGA domain-containing protein [Sorangium aterium]MDC0676551.1 PEGA domain-containing protein [Sorangium aterium]